MTWRDLYPKMLEKNSKEACLVFSHECFERAAIYTDDLFVHEVAALVKSNLSEAMKRQQQIAVIRATTKDLRKMEAAHIILHLIEVALSNNPISAAGHAARCGEALSRIDSKNELLCG